VSKWKLISNHGAVLAYVAKHPRVPAVDVARAVGVRERTVRRIIADLEADGYLEKERVGRSNTYKVNFEAPLRRQIHRNCKVKDLLSTLQPLVEIDDEADLCGRGSSAKVLLCTLPLAPVVTALLDLHLSG
jgi:DeoR/GlpR family transcriptional regulator of sugar metabolism